MPAKSQAQRGFLAVHFGPDWMKEHHFANKGKLPERVGPKPTESELKKEKAQPKAK